MKNKAEPKTTMINKQKYLVQKHLLKNGMTVLVMEDHSQPKVSIQVFYHVGSKDEHDGEKGIAHLIEHMIFKGTAASSNDTKNSNLQNGKAGHSLSLSESDINAIAQTLSAETNAFTSDDYTGYLFNLPSTQWKDVLPVLADCMKNAEFDDQKLNSEMKAVIQELKMYRDSYTRVLIQEFLSVLFTNHPYHYPVIGYKKDLFSVSGENLRNFYEKHYVPNNATIIIVGDVLYADVVDEVEKAFGHIEAKPDYKKERYEQEEDIIKKSMTLYRDIQQPIGLCLFFSPGLRKKQEAAITLSSWILGEKRHCRLYKKLVHDLQLATYVNASDISFFDHGIFYIIYYPKSVEFIPHIEKIITETLSEIATNGISDEEIERAIKNYKMNFFEMMDDYQERAESIGISFLSTGDPSYMFDIFQNKTEEEIKKETVDFIKQYLRPTVMHTGLLIPIPDSEKDRFAQLQKESDQIDTEILATRARLSEVEPPRYAETIIPKNPTPFIFPKPEERLLKNGLKLLLYNKSQDERVTIALQLKAHDSSYGPEDKPGLYNFMAQMLQEGTKNRDSESLAEFLEMRGMSLHSMPGIITIECLSQDIENALIILKEIITESNFQEESIKKVRAQLITNIKAFWDNPKQFSNHLFDEVIYKGHPWSINNMGTVQSIAGITKNDLEQLYQKIMSPDGATLAIVGAIDTEKINNLVKTHFDSWKFFTVEPMRYPMIEKSAPKEINYYIERDQIVLMLGNLSINRNHPDFEKLLIFDQFFGGGVLGSMMSHLFQLRESTGLFYGISGSTISGSDEQPGKFVIKTIVSKDRLNEAIAAIMEAIDSAVNTITDENIADAKRAILYTQVDKYKTSNSITNTFLYLNRLKLPYDYYDMRYKRFESISKDDIIEATKKHLNSDSLVVLKVGRV